MSKCSFNHEDLSQKVSLTYDPIDGTHVNNRKLMSSLLEVMELLRYVEGTLSITPKELENECS